MSGVSVAIRVDGRAVGRPRIPVARGPRVHRRGRELPPGARQRARERDRAQRRRAAKPPRRPARPADRAAEPQPLPRPPASTRSPARATQERSVAVLFLDLDQFKIVNDSLGHAAGDELLAAVAPRLEQAVRPSDTVARFGGDEFAVLAEDVMNERDAIRVAERIAEALTRPFVLRKREHFASASVGIAIGSGDRGARRADPRRRRRPLPRQGPRPRRLRDLRRRDALARDRPHADRERPAAGAAARGARAALPADPALSDDAVVVYEALLRWNHPIRGLLPPAAFIPVAEESRLIVPVGRWAIEEACRQAAAWQARDPDGPPVGVSVNLSALQVTDPSLVHAVRSALESSGLEATTLRLELTETHPDGGGRGPARGARGPPRPRRPADPRRLRDRVLLARLPEAPAAVRDQARPLVRREPERGRPGRRHRPRGHRDGDVAGPRRLRGGRRDPAAARRASASSAAATRRASTSAARSRRASFRPSRTRTATR